MAGWHPESNSKETVIPFCKSPAGRREESARWQTLLVAVADIHAIIIRGMLSGALQEDEAGPTVAAGAALLAAFDDLDLLLRATGAFIHIYGCNPYSFATRLSRMAKDLDDCERIPRRTGLWLSLGMWRAGSVGGWRGIWRVLGTQRDLRMSTVPAASGGPRSGGAALMPSEAAEVVG